MKNTRAKRFTTYEEVLEFINNSKGTTNVRLYEDGQSVIVTYEIYGVSE